MTKVILSACVLFIILCLTFRKTNGCSCFPTHPQMKFCSSDFVFVGKVLSMKLIPGKKASPGRPASIGKQALPGKEASPGKQASLGEKGPPGNLPDPNNLDTRVYRLRLIMKIKDKKTSRLRRIVTIHTGESSATCGITLTVGKKYLLAGRVDKNKQKRVGLCDLVESNLNFEQMGYYFGRGRNSYIRNCQCQITFSDPKSCTLPRSFDSCYFETALCIKTRTGCKWSNNECDK